MKELITDAGHGGKDIGASKFGYIEKDLNLIVTKRVNEILGNSNTTRTTDIYIDPSRRTDLIRSKYKYAISIHFNAGGGNGIEAIHSVHSTKGKVLAQSIVNEMQKTTGLPLRPKPVFSRTLSNGSDYYYMHRDTGNTITVIVECMFLDNIENVKKLNIESIAQGIANGYKKFTGGVVPTVTPSKTTVTPPKSTAAPLAPLLTYSGYLSQGSTGNSVRALQTALKALGYYKTAIDGSFGGGTRTSVMNFQRANKLVVDGFAGQGTVVKINSLLRR